MRPSWNALIVPDRAAIPCAAQSTRSVLGRSQVVRQRILIPPFPGSNPGAPAKSQRAEFFAETALFSREFLGAFGNGFRPPFGNSVLLCSSSCFCAKRCACRLRRAFDGGKRRCFARERSRGMPRALELCYKRGMAGAQ